MPNLKIRAILMIIAFMVCHISFAAANKPKTKSQAQQKRLKINPMSDYEGAWIANIETDAYSVGTFENLSIGYSANDGWDFSVSLLNAQVLGNNNHFQGNTFINIAKTFDINNRFAITLGSQNGVALVNTEPQLWFNFTFIDNRFDVTDWLSIHGGPYLANAALTGTSLQVGFFTGTEITFIPNQLSLQMDYISGSHSLSGASVHLLLNITPRSQIYLGVLVPEQNSGTEFAGIVGFNLSTHQL